MNPVKAGLTNEAADWSWSSTLAHLAGCNDNLVKVRPLLKRVDDVRQFLSHPGDPALEQALIKGQSVGRPLMSNKRLAALEKRLKTKETFTPRSAGAAKEGREGRWKTEINRK